jgi:tape measure domain-containing protein
MTGRFNSLPAYKAQLKEMENSAKQSAINSEKHINGIKFDPLKAQLMDLRNAFLYTISAGSMKAVADVGLQFESVRASYKGMTGSLEEANKAFEFVKENSKETGVNILNSAKDFRILVGASQGAGYSMEILEKSFSAVSTASAVLGLRADDTTGIMRALGQIMSKGTVQSEELKGQIGDRLPGALGLAAKAMGKTNAELLKMMENGELMSKEFIPKFVDAINDQYVKGLTEAQKTALFAFKDIFNSFSYRFLFDFWFRSIRISIINQFNFSYYRFIWYWSNWNWITISPTHWPPSA